MLGLFSMFSLSNAYMWIHLNIIANVVLRYYNASLPSNTLQQESAVDWLSMIYMLAYLLLIPIGRPAYLLLIPIGNQPALHDLHAGLSAAHSYR